MRHAIFLPTVILLVLQSLALPPEADAQQGWGGPGVGLILGEPTGLSLKTSLRARGSLDAAAAWSFEGNGYLHLHGDLLFHNWNAANLRVEDGRLGFYYGIGARAVFRNNDPWLGLRVPLGISYLISNSPLELFGELAPILDLTPNSTFRVNGGLGLRYWLN
ncbi:hypothetical protein ACFL6X_09545 [Candidatus Latescibacterota bacterium]